MQELNQRNFNAWSRLGQRGSIFGLALPEIAREKTNLRVVTADLGFTSGLDRFKNAWPDRYINVGIAEQNMIGIAAGLAKEGNCVFSTTFATFISLRCLEQVRHNLGYMKFNVKVVGSAAGFAIGMFGNTHYAIEDIAVMRAIPNMAIISPADATEAYLAAFAVSETDTPAYIRLTGQMNCPIVYKEKYSFDIGKGVVLRKGADVALIGTGTIVHEALGAADILGAEGISCSVINMHTIKPLDTNLLDTVFSEHQLIVTVEEHSVIGGLGSAVAEYKCLKANAPCQLTIGIPDYFGKAGEYQYLLEQYGLTAKKIAISVKTKFEENRKWKST
jgi:transketolase